MHFSFDDVLDRDVQEKTIIDGRWYVNSSSQKREILTAKENALKEQIYAKREHIRQIRELIRKNEVSFHDLFASRCVDFFKNWFAKLFDGESEISKAQQEMKNEIILPTIALFHQVVEERRLKSYNLTQLKILEAELEKNSLRFMGKLSEILALASHLLLVEMEENKAREEDVAIAKFLLPWKLRMLLLPELKNLGEVIREYESLVLNRLRIPLFNKQYEMISTITRYFPDSHGLERLEPYCASVSHLRKIYSEFDLHLEKDKIHIDFDFRDIVDSKENFNDENSTIGSDSLNTND